MITILTPTPNGYKRGCHDVELNIRIEDARKGYHQGLCDDDIAELQKKDYIKQQLNPIPLDTLCSILDEYGCEYDDDDDKEELEGIALWLACGDILDEVDNFENVD